MAEHARITITDEELSQWAASRADDAGRLARELIQYRRGALPADVISLVIAAREFWDIHNDLSDESGALDDALRPFSSKVRYSNEPDEGDPSPRSRP